MRRLLPFLVALAACADPPAAEPLVVEVETAAPGRFVLLSGGDTDVGNHASGLLRERGWDWPFEHLDAHLDADARMLNLETVVTDHVASPPLDKEYVHRMEPEALDALTERGFSLVSLANNHGMDQKAEGLLDMLDRLDAAGVGAVGAGSDEARSRRAVVLDAGGFRVGVLGLFDPRSDFDRWDWFAGADRPGIARFEQLRLEADIEALKERADFVIASLHWGQNYEPEDEAQRAWASALVRAGADLVNGHGAHLAQGVELVDGVPVLYSLGNFVFTSRGRFESLSPDLRCSVLARFVFADGAIEAIELLPLLSDNEETGYQPAVPEPARAERELRPVLERHGLSWSATEQGWYRWEP